MELEGRPMAAIAPTYRILCQVRERLGRLPQEPGT